jgi:hypothetical protein
MAQWSRDARTVTRADGSCECGWRGGRACGALRDALVARDFEQPALYWRFHRLAVDAYCVQHEAYVRSGKSFAAHLCGLCIAFEHGGDQALHRRLVQWLSTNPAIRRPELPWDRGALHVGDVVGIDDPVEYGRAVSAWGRGTWQAYLELQPLAREWISHAARGSRFVAGPSGRTDG